jgi:hypothetical protein
MNHGIQASRGSWLYFLGGDDYLWGTRVLESVFTALRRGDADVLYGNVVHRHSGRVYDGRFSRRKLIKRNVCHQAIFYARTVFTRLGLFDTKYPYLADYVFNLRCFGARRIRIRHVQQIIAVFNDVGGASTLLDRAFQEDRLKLVRNHLGFRYYLLAGLEEHRYWRAMAPWVRL